MTKDLYHPVLETFMQALPYTYRLIEAESHTSIKVMIEGDAGGQWILTKGPNGWDLTENEVDSRIMAEIVMEQEVAWKLFTNAFFQIHATESVRIRGSRVLASPILSMLTLMV